jgi:hypothetical protein
MQENNTYKKAAVELVKYCNKKFTGGFLGTPKANIYRHLTLPSGKQVKDWLIEMYRESLKTRGHNEGRWAHYLFNNQDKERWNILYNVAYNYARKMH